MIDEKDFKKALGKWYWALDEYLQWDDKEFQDMLKKYGYTEKQIIDASMDK